KEHFNDGIPNEHQLNFNYIKDAKSLLEAIEKRFGGNDSTKKTQRNFLKQQYENFIASCSESLDQTFDRLQKLLILVLELLLLALRESTRSNVPIETTNSSNLVSCTALGGFDWSDQAEEGPNYALMAYFTSCSDFEVSTESNCSKTCLKTVETLKSQNEQLLNDSKKSELMVLGYKAGLKSIEERLEFFKTNESIYSEDIKKLKFEIHCNEITIRELRKKLETVQKEKDGIQLTVEKLENASKSLNKLIDSQTVDNCKKGLGYNAVPPPHTGLFMPPKPDLSYIGLDEFTSEHVVETLNAKTSKEVPKAVKKDNGAPSIKDRNSDDKDESVPQPKIVYKTVKPSVAKVEFVKPKQ
nr:ribonuclease H-like domain-containing protein [Tanacetum cinerariifolium]